MSSDQSAIESRLQKLEQSNRRLLLLCFGLPCLAFFLGADAADKMWTGKKIVAEEIVLTDSEGEIKATLHVRDGSANFVLLDGNGTGRVRLSADAESAGPVLVLGSKNGKPALIAGTNKDSGIGSVDFHDDGVYKGGVGGRALHGK